MPFRTLQAHSEEITDLDIAFVTSEDWPELTPDDRLAAVELERAGSRVHAAVWTDDGVDWQKFDVAVLRSCWDYHHRYDEFTEWLDRMERLGVALINDVATVRWNLDKRYLLELSAAGAGVIPTVLAAPGRQLAELMAERGWDVAVLKPCISADGNRTSRVRVDDAAAHQGELEELAAGTGALVQQYVKEIAEAGELSFIFLGGAFSHCVVKKPAAGEFRVQARYGGTAELFDAPQNLVAQAREVVQASGRAVHYARVDGCVVDGRLLLMELELIEPSLFLDLDAQAPARLANAILRAARIHS